MAQWQKGKCLEISQLGIMRQTWKCLNVYWGTILNWWLIGDTGGWISIHRDKQELDEVTGRSVCVCVTKCDSFQCMLMRIWTCGPVINFWIIYCGSLFSKHLRGNLYILTHCVQHVLCVKMGLMSTSTWPSINNTRLSCKQQWFTCSQHWWGCQYIHSPLEGIHRGTRIHSAPFWGRWEYIEKVCLQGF